MGRVYKRLDHDLRYRLARAIRRWAKTLDAWVSPPYDVTTKTKTKG